MTAKYNNFYLILLKTKSWSSVKFVRATRYGRTVAVRLTVSGCQVHNPLQMTRLLGSNTLNLRRFPSLPSRHSCQTLSSCHCLKLCPIQRKRRLQATTWAKPGHLVTKFLCVSAAPSESFKASWTNDLTCDRPGIQSTSRVSISVDSKFFKNTLVIDNY